MPERARFPMFLFRFKERLPLLFICFRLYSRTEVAWKYFFRALLLYDLPGTDRFPGRHFLPCTHHHCFQLQHIFPFSAHSTCKSSIPSYQVRASTNTMWTHKITCHFNATCQIAYLMRTASGNEHCISRILIDAPRSDSIFVPKLL